MRRTLVLCVLFFLAALGRAQNPARGELFTRVEGDVLKAAVVVELQPGYHIYHSELGHPRAVGKPTTLTFEGSASFTPARFPEPERFDQSEIEPGLFILGHEGTLTLYAAGRLAPGADGSDLVIKINGLVCDASGCVLYRQTLKPKGRGTDELFAAFPADLAPPAAASTPTPAATSTPAAQAAPEVPRDDAKKKGRADGELYTRVEGDEVRVALRFTIEPGWHLYHSADDLGQGAIGKPTRIELHGEGIEWQAARFPTPEKIDQSEFGEGNYIHAHSGTITVYARGTLTSGASGAGRWAKVTGQTCDDKTCLDYEEVLADRGPGPDELWSGFAAGQTSAPAADAPAPGSDVAQPAPAQSAPVEEEPQSLLLFLLAAVGGGLFALVMPCTYPMIPITISFFTKQADKGGKNALGLSLAYGAGIVLIFVLIGLLFGSLIIPFATHPVTNLVIGVAFLYFSFVLFGLVNLQPPAFLMNAAGSASQKGGYAGVFLMGATLVVTSFTCTAPFVGSLLAAGARDGDVLRLALGMATFGLTMAVPFVLLSLVPTRLKAMPRSGEWMNTFKTFLGFVELAAALKFVSNADIVWEWTLLSRELFLMLWSVIFVLAALYLFGVFTPGAPLGGKRRLGAAATLVFAFYSFWGMCGRPLDWVMTAIVPPYSGGVLGWTWYETRADWTMFKDDYELALERARGDKKLLLLNFTGHTCVNCRVNEEKIFPRPRIATLLRDGYVEARLHTDGEQNIERILELQAELARTIANPTYVIQDPVTKRILGAPLSGTVTEAAFARYLESALEAKEQVGRLSGS